MIPVSLPAFGTGDTATCIEAVDGVQGATPVTVYTYVFDKSIAGLNSPLPLAKAGDQVPPVCAFGPNKANKSKGALEKHTATGLVGVSPALGWMLTVKLII